MENGFEFVDVVPEDSVALRGDESVVVCDGDGVDGSFEGVELPQDVSLPQVAGKDFSLDAA